MNALRRIARDERGFSMVAVMMVMLVSGLFVTAAFAMADGDLPIGKRYSDRKEAYAAAEAGVQFYAFHLAQDNRYWVHCTNVTPPNTTEPSPVVQKWYGTGLDTRRNNWRTVPGTNAQYAIELLPAAAPTTANPTPQCIENNEASMLDPDTGMFRVRVTGRKGAAKRTIIASFRRKSLLDYLWLTNFETQDPNNYPPNGYTWPNGTPSMTPIWAASACDDYRGSRNGACKDQMFAPDDKILGPLHTNDVSIWTCDGSTFGRTGKNDTLEVTGPGPAWDNQCGSSAPTSRSTWQTGRDSVDIPLSNSSLQATAAAGGRVFTGVTRIRLAGNQMYVTNGTTVNQPQTLPGNGVIFVKTGAGGCTGNAPILADYTESSSCGNVYISGTYNQNLTVAAQNDVIVAPTDPASPGDADVLRANGSDDVLGLIADNFVRVAHRVTRSDWNNPDSCSNLNNAAYPNLGDVEIDAAILSVQHSFTVDNYGCGAHEGDLTVKGVIAQNYRGTVGKSNGSGYFKDYNYDDLMKYRTPPYFLEPIQAPWRVARTNEQVPAT